MTFQKHVDEAIRRAVSNSKGEVFVNQPRTITYHRNPTKRELKFGEGAIHYKDFDYDLVWDSKNDRPKAWVKCPIDGLRYYY